MDGGDVGQISEQKRYQVDISCYCPSLLMIVFAKSHFHQSTKRLILVRSIIQMHPTMAKSKVIHRPMPRSQRGNMIVGFVSRGCFFFFLLVDGDMCFLISRFSLHHRSHDLWGRQTMLRRIPSKKKTHKPTKRFSPNDKG